MKKQAGQAMITLIFFTVIASTIITAAVSVLFSNILSTTTADMGLRAYYAAETGAEEGLLQLLRHPEYVTSVAPTQTIDIEDGTVTVSIDHGNIISVGSINSGNIVRKIEVQTQFNSNGSFDVTSWKEIP